jgi:hypothetical protein
MKSFETEKLNLNEVIGCELPCIRESIYKGLFKDGMHMARAIPYRLAAGVLSLYLNGPLREGSNNLLPSPIKKTHLHAICVQTRCGFPIPFNGGRIR